MPGRSCGSSCTQRSPTWMHRRSSCGRRPAAGQPSSSSPAPPRLQCLQTCTPASRISLRRRSSESWRQVLRRPVTISRRSTP
uniref:Uncharacterized protein n=1 Tax=Oryza nivara TaxID=4536 RepID=A0A0E0HG98_ORYNI